MSKIEKTCVYISLQVNLQVTTTLGNTESCLAFLWFLVEHHRPGSLDVVRKYWTSLEVLSRWCSEFPSAWMALESERMPSGRRKAYTKTKGPGPEGAETFWNPVERPSERERAGDSGNWRMPHGINMGLTWLLDGCPFKPLPPAAFLSFSALPYSPSSAQCELYLVALGLSWSRSVCESAVPNT